MSEEVEYKRTDKFDRLLHRKFYVSAAGNIFNALEFLNINEHKRGWKPLPLDEYPYTVIQLPVVVDKNILRERLMDCTWKGQMLRNYNYK